MPLSCFREIFLPYLIRDYGDGTYAILNREYCDLGTDEAAMRDADRRKKTRYRLKGIGKKTLQRIACGDPRMDPGGGVNYWLYDNASEPHLSPDHWKAYQAKLKILMRAKVPLG